MNFLKKIDIRSALIGALSVTLVFTLMSSRGPGASDEITCKSITLLNNSGGKSITLQCNRDGNGGALRCYNSQGNLTAFMGTNDEGSGAHARFFNGTNTETCLIGTSSAGYGMIDARNKDGKEVAYLGSNTYADGEILVSYTNGQKGLYVTNGFLKSYNDQGTQTTYIGTTTSGGGTMQAFNSSGTKVVYIGNATDDGGTLQLKDKNGTDIFTK